MRKSIIKNSNTIEDQIDEMEENSKSASVIKKKKYIHPGSSKKHLKNIPNLLRQSNMKKLRDKQEAAMLRELEINPTGSIASKTLMNMTQGITNRSSVNVFSVNSMGKRNEHEESRLSRLSKVSKRKRSTPKDDLTIMTEKSRRSNSRRYTAIKSPTMDIVRSGTKKQFKTEIDHNSLAEKKFLDDAKYAAKKRLSTKSLRHNSPDKFSTQSARADHSKMMTTFYGANTLVDLGLHFGNAGASQVWSNKLLKPSELVLTDIIDNNIAVSDEKYKIDDEDRVIEKAKEFKLKFKAEPPKKESKDNTLDFDEDLLATDFTEERYRQALEAAVLMMEADFEELEMNEKVTNFLNMFEDTNLEVRFGSLVATYIVLKKYPLDEDIKIDIIEATLKVLNSYDCQDETILVTALEIVSLYSLSDAIAEKLELFGLFITDKNYPKLRKAAFNCLMGMDNEGLAILVGLAGEDKKETQTFILENMVKTPHVQKNIIVKALINEVYSNNQEKRHASLAALNRLYGLVGETQSVLKLARFFDDPKIEKILLASAIRTTGPTGESILLQELREHKDHTVRIAIASALSYRLPKKPSYLEIRLDKNDTICNSRNPPGNFCTYIGSNLPLLYEEDDDEEGEENFLEVNSRDVLAALQRTVTNNVPQRNVQLVFEGNTNLIDDFDFVTNPTEDFEPFADFFNLHAMDEESSIEEDLKDGVFA